MRDIMEAIKITNRDIRVINTKRDKVEVIIILIFKLSLLIVILEFWKLNKIRTNLDELQTKHIYQQKPNGYSGGNRYYQKRHQSASDK